MTNANTASVEPPVSANQPADDWESLHLGLETPPEPAAIARGIEPQIAERLERTAWWPGHELRENWALGDYSVYSMSFAAWGYKALCLRFISEPDRDAMLDISASNEDQRLRTTAPDALRAQLTAAGFRPGGARGGYCKPVLVESREDCAALAGEITRLVTGPLGYTGTGPLEHAHGFLERTQPGRVFTSITLGDIERLLRSSKLLVWRCDRKFGPGFWTAKKPHFQVLLFSEVYSGCGWYRALRFRFSLPMEDERAEGLIQVMQPKHPFARMSVGDGRLRLDQIVLVDGGVTEACLRTQLRHWRNSVDTVVAVSRRLEAEDAED